MDESTIMRALNSRNKNLQVDVQIITLADNLEHPYFSLIELSKNNLSPIGIAKMEAPYTPYISHYWIKYQGEVVISFNMVDMKQVNTNSESFFNYVNEGERKRFLEKKANKQAEEDKTTHISNEEEKEYIDMTPRFQNDHYNYSFIGKISQFKQKGNKFVIYFEDLGWKFLQKVPKDFRSNYVAGQYLDDAFQAICEFLDVRFAYSIEDLHEYTFANDGYSIQKDGKTIEDVETVLSEWGMTEVEDNEEETDELDDPSNENPDLVKLDQANENNENYIKTDPNSTQTGTAINSEEETEEDDTQSVQDKIDKYQDDFDKKILDLFIGNSYYDSNLTDPILDYGKITITPKLVTDESTSTMSNVSMDSNGDGTVSDEEAKAYGQNLLNSAKTGVVLKNVQLTGTSKVALSYDQVNAMSFIQAREEAQKTNKYYWTTILRLRARGALYTVGPGTPYSKFNY